MKCLFTIGILAAHFFSYCQTYEGWITYKMEMENPMASKITEEQWQEITKEKFGEKGYIEQQYFYKEGNYTSHMIAARKGCQTYNPDDGLLYSWEENSDTAITVDSKKYMDKFDEIVDAKGTDTIMGIVCKSVIVKSKMGEMTLWYNSDYFKMDATLYEGHIYGHWEQILNKIGCLPLKMNHKAFMMNMTQTMIEYKEEAVDDITFEIPEFKVVIENPIN